MTTDPAGFRTIILEGCAHRPKLAPPPERGSILWCPPCGIYRTVKDSGTVHYKVKCLLCPASRTYDRGVKLAAKQFIAQHRTKYPEHTLVLMNGLRVERIIEPDSNGQQPPLDNGAPPY